MAISPTFVHSIDMVMTFGANTRLAEKGWPRSRAAISHLHHPILDALAVRVHRLLEGHLVSIVGVIEENAARPDSR